MRRSQPIWNFQRKKIVLYSSVLEPPESLPV
jgi:hypothetical protein